ncbi:hypothetical protein Nepgr_032059 [Nepenthes gracilis]|uniref:Uncharacterized protein n=1 Tax=Nepenthes gracilis TaxID=150966 RepID=A0AAD3TJM2_NEPGR|nr:hypothetical protein Nepgr_032059 [Nepenthes gracilis]
MGCIVSKRAASALPASYDPNSGEIQIKRRANSQYNNESGSRKRSDPLVLRELSLEKRYEEPPEREDKEMDGCGGKKLKSSKSKCSASHFSLTLRFGTVKNQASAEQCAGGLARMAHGGRG